MKIAVVNGETENTIYLYEESGDWACSAQIAVHVRRGVVDLSSDDANTHLRELLRKAIANLTHPQDEPPSAEACKTATYPTAQNDFSQKAFL